MRKAERHTAGTITGYIGFIFGVLCVISVASEFGEPLPTGEAAFTVLVTMLIGYAIGWLIQPVIAIMFPQS